MLWEQLLFNSIYILKSKKNSNYFWQAMYGLWPELREELFSYNQQLWVSLISEIDLGQRISKEKKICDFMYILDSNKVISCKFKSVNFFFICQKHNSAIIGIMHGSTVNSLVA